MDDLIISNTFEEHLHHHDIVLYTLERASPNGSPNWHPPLHADQHRQRHDMIGIDKNRKQGILSCWPKPSSLADIFSCLASLNYINSFLPRAKEILHSFYAMIRRSSNGDLKRTKAGTKRSWWNTLTGNPMKTFVLFYDSSKITISSAVLTKNLRTGDVDVKLCPHTYKGDILVFTHQYIYSYTPNKCVRAQTKRHDWIVCSLWMNNMHIY